MIRALTIGLAIALLVFLVTAGHVIFLDQAGGSFSAGQT